MREAAQIQIDFCFLRDDSAAYDVAEPVPENPWATILCAVDVATQNPLAIALPGKNAELEYVTGQLVSFIKRLGYTEVVIRSDGEPSITAIVDKEDRCAGTSETRENTSLQFTILGCSGKHAITVAKTGSNSQN